MNKDIGMNDNSFLSDFSEEEYGNGDEISSTTYLIFGILTLWIYSVWKYYDTYHRHLENRLNYFQKQLEPIKLESKTESVVKKIIKDGFVISSQTRNISITLYSISIVLIIAELILQQAVANLYITFYWFDLATKTFTALASFLFCGSTIYFLTWVIQKFKNHEYNELLLYRLINNPNGFKLARPSVIFKKRWEKNQNIVAFFLILSIPMILSPLIAVNHIYSVIQSGGDHVVYILIWSIVIFILAGIFHLWGTSLLVSMYNDHLRIEIVNRSQLSDDTKWSSKSSESVIQKNDITDKAMFNTSELTPKRTLAAIMLTDMFGFSKDMEICEGATYEKLLKHHEIIRKEIATNNGKEIKTIGDAFLIKFASAVDAVKSAINIQKKLSDYNETVEDPKKIKVRIGIHIGDVLIMGDDVIGNGVNIAARIEPLAEVGGICISSDVYNIIRKALDIKVVNIGRKELKNIQDAPEIYRIVLESIGK
jgi:class 3 adenylate cyclase